MRFLRPVCISVLERKLEVKIYHTVGGKSITKEISLYCLCYVLCAVPLAVCLLHYNTAKPLTLECPTSSLIIQRFKYPLPMQSELG
jgi:hypothetical protein